MIGFDVMDLCPAVPDRGPYAGKMNCTLDRGHRGRHEARGAMNLEVLHSWSSRRRWIPRWRR